ncbi:CxxH/CxxC protein [Lysinibacillus yapensis]|uniref:CxxH/CxxC protein n=1 Tax=Ureibacillus yapensis TaxID=2304605 RepID=A0A396SCQ5_9BACL|nr:CxxH/CxxC protein [Lysinibacillus yapensis]RHW36138.1 CxxH/CxxC protein [Lysinibacillus yapensis]
MISYSCETHINQALDMFVAETEEFPILDKVSEEEKLSTKCSYCEEHATYIVSSK